MLCDRLVHFILFVIMNAFSNFIFLVLEMRRGVYVFSGNGILRLSFFYLLLFQNILFFFFAVWMWIRAAKKSSDYIGIKRVASGSDIHEINNAITIILGNVIQLKEKINLKEDGLILSAHLEQIEIHALKVSKAYLRE